MRTPLFLLGCSFILLSGCANQDETPLDPGPWSFVLSPETTEAQVCANLADNKTAHWLPLRARNKANTVSNYMDKNSFQFQQQQGRVIYRGKSSTNPAESSFYYLKIADCKTHRVKQGALYGYMHHLGGKPSTCEKMQEDAATFVWVTPKEIPAYGEVLEQICKPSAQKASS